MPDGLSQSLTFRHNLKSIGRRNLPFDLCFSAGQLPLAEDLIKSCPDQISVLKHCGVPNIASGDFESWAAYIKNLAALPNIYCKLFCIAAYCAPSTASFETLKPWVYHVIEEFWPSRIVWGSDWPVVNLGISLQNWIALTEQLLAGLSSDESGTICFGNAHHVYKF